MHLSHTVFLAFLCFSVFINTVRAQPQITAEPQDTTIQAGQRATIRMEIFFGGNPANFRTAYIGTNPDTSNPSPAAIFTPVGGEAFWQSDPLFKSTQVWFSFCNDFGCATTRTVTIFVENPEPDTPPAPFDDAVSLGDNWWNSEWFGDLNLEFYPWVFHLQHGWMFVFDGANRDSMFLYDLSLEGWFWTSSTEYPNLFSFSRPGWVFYFRGTSGPRQFADLQTGELFSVD